MEKLIIPLSAFTEQGFAVDVELSNAIFDLDSNGGLSVSAVHIVGDLESVGSEYLFRGTLSGAYTHPCDRCLESCGVPYTLDVVWYFEPGVVSGEIDPGEIFETTEELAEEGEPIRCFSGNEIDLTEHIREEILLTIPIKFLCKQDCKGLCPRCGANLNTGPCSCPEESETGHPGLAKLAEQFPHLRPSEE